ncbi:1-acyl-sn-glycerol-3-phosphate acyltransferase [Abditibacteriota bacterium]|nr:1-acyl-sn-glycerol-3-phosphate acyltransferase [Abditibacteriota bacterium]
MPRKKRGLPRGYLLTFPIYSTIIRVATRLLCPRFHVSGRTNIPNRGAVIFASNHLSDIDPPVIGAAVRYPLCYMAKRELWEIGWLGKLLTFMGCIPVDPGSPDRKALKACRTMLDAREPVVIFPEGKISSSAEMLPLLPGTVSLALGAKVPIIPIGIWGVQQALPYGQTIPRPTFAKVNLHFGPPIHLDDLYELQGREAREVATRRLDAALRAAVDVAKRG